MYMNINVREPFKCFLGWTRKKCGLILEPWDPEIQQSSTFPVEVIVASSR